MPACVAFCYAFSQAMEETILDTALKAALADAKQGNFFYDVFLNTDLVVPVQEKNAGKGSWKCLGIEEKFYPLFLKFENGRAVPIFDTVDKLKNWAATKPLDYILIKGHHLIQMIDPSLFLVINLGMELNYTLTPQVLEQLRNSMTAVTPS